jgi:hypothetical protein
VSEKVRIRARRPVFMCVSPVSSRPVNFAALY